jgi:hypothetical protein
VVSAAEVEVEVEVKVEVEVEVKVEVAVEVEVEVEVEVGKAPWPVRTSSTHSPTYVSIVGHTYLQTHVNVNTKTQIIH